MIKVYKIKYINCYMNSEEIHSYRDFPHACLPIGRGEGVQSKLFPLGGN
jgi:hypothetical protein